MPDNSPGLNFIRPHSLEEASAALKEYGFDAKVLAGGTAVVLMMQEELIDPDVIVSLDQLTELDYIREEQDGLHVGALTSLREVARSPLVQEGYPVLASSCGSVGNVRIRNQATLAGNLAEADYAADPPAALLALDAQVYVRGPNGSRHIPLSEFYLGFYTTVLEPDELITEISVPRPAEEARMTYMKYKSRSSEDRPCVGVAVVAEMDGLLCHGLSVGVGAACEVPTRLADFEGLAEGETLTQELIDEVARGYAENVVTLDDMRGSAWYRKQMIEVHVARALGKVRDEHR